MPNSQEIVYYNVRKRGYLYGSPELDAIRQSLKALEEIIEQLECIDGDCHQFSQLISSLVQPKLHARQLFRSTNPDIGTLKITDMEAFCKEQADVTIPMLCQAEILGRNLLDDCLDKSENDINRGVSK
jgi:hypothetical protein